MRILLAEAEPTVARTIAAFLEKWRMEAILAQSAREVWDTLAESHVDLLIMDLVMPGTSGIELVSDLRRSERYQDLPVLMMSGRAQKQDIIEANEVGINDFIAKPFSSAELKKKILEVHKKQKELTRKRQIAQIWEGRTTYLHELSSPHVIFGEPIDSLAELRDPGNREVLAYLANACGAIANANAECPGLNAGYIIESQTSDLLVHLKSRRAKEWVRGIFLSTRCRGNPTLIVRLFGINSRDDIPVFLIYDNTHDISAGHKEGLKKLGVRTIKRSSLDEDRIGKLITKVIARSEKQEAKEEILSPEAIRGRVVEDIETMTTLPTLPQVYEKISRLARDPHSDLKEWIKAIKVDPMSCATILRHANSLSYGFRGEITQIDKAIILLGKNTVSGLVASEAVRQTFSTIQEHGFALDEFWLHNLAVGFASYILSIPLDKDSARSAQAGNVALLGLSEETTEHLRELNLPERLKLDYGRVNAFVGGIMHDIGKAVMVQSYPGLFPMVLTELKRNNWNASMLMAEQEVAGGLKHTVAGEILIRKWKLGEELGNVVLSHHNPSVDDTFPFLVGIADVIGQIVHPFPSEAEYPLAAALEDNSLRGVSQFLPEGFFAQPLLSVDEFTLVAKAILPKVKYLTEKMRLTVA